MLSEHEEYELERITEELANAEKEMKSFADTIRTEIEYIQSGRSYNECHGTNIALLGARMAATGAKRETLRKRKQLLELRKQRQK